MSRRGWQPPIEPAMKPSEPGAGALRLPEDSRDEAGARSAGTKATEGLRAAGFPARRSLRRGVEAGLKETDHSRSRGPAWLKPLLGECPGQQPAASPPAICFDLAGMR